MKRALILLLLFPPLAAAQFKPVEVRAKAPALAVIKSEASSEVHWVYDPRSIVPGQVYADKANKTLVVGGPVVLYVSAIEFQTGKGFVQTDYLVTIEGGGPPPPPPPPVPDTFLGRLTTAYKTDAAVGKMKVEELRTVHQIAAQAHLVLDIAPDTTALYGLMDFAFDRAVTKGDMPTLLPLVKDRIRATAAVGVKLDAALQAAFRLTFIEVAKAIESLLGPLPPPTPIGARTVVIVRETADATPELALLLASLRAGSQAKYLKEKGHTLTILDDDAVGPGGKPAPLLEKWRPHYQGMTFPALLIADAAGAIVSKTTLPASATAEDVIAAIKKAGG